MMTNSWLGSSDPEVPEGIPAPSEAECAVYLLGRMRVVRAGRPIEGGWRRKSLELLAYLAVHPHGVSKDQMLEALWPNGDPLVTQRCLWNVASYLRRRLQGSGVDARITQKTDDLYRLNLDAVWMDVQAFVWAIRLSESVSDPRALLAFACHLYKGEFCEGRYYGWDTLVRERLSRCYIEAARSLTRNREAHGENEGALAVLESAMAVDPYDEDLCRQAMLLDELLGRPDRAVRRFKRLRRLLRCEFSIEPSEKTACLAEQVSGGWGDSPPTWAHWPEASGCRGRTVDFKLGTDTHDPQDHI